MKKYVFIIILALNLLLTGCGDGSAAEMGHSHMMLAMGTVINLTAYGEDGKAALLDAERELDRLDELLARGVEGSAVYVYNHTGSTEDEELSRLIARAEEYHVPTAEELSAAPRLLDLGGIAKGYAGERMFRCMVENSVGAAVFDLGGDVALWGDKPGEAWRVAIKDPASSMDYLGVLETAGDRFVMTSGVYERYFEENGVQYHHVIDPQTRLPAESGLVSVTVVCENGVWADALATACCVMGAEKTLALRESLAETMPFDLILVDLDGRVLYTCEGFTPEPGTAYIYEKLS